jgi:hypothetical protein
MSAVTTRARPLLRTLVIAVLPIFLACDPGSLATPAPAACAEAGAQCQLAQGPLGVCERSPCAAGAAPPCFRCTPQH